MCQSLILIFYVKKYLNISDFFIEAYEFRSTFFVIDNFDKINF